MCDVYNFVTGDVLRYLPFSPKTVFFLPQKSFITDGTLRQQVTLYSLHVETILETSGFLAHFREAIVVARFWAGKYVSGAKRGKYATGAKRGKNMQPVSSAGKHATCSKRQGHTTGAKRGKTCNRFQAQEIIQPMPCAGKHATDAKRGKYATGAKRGSVCTLDCLGK